MAHSDSKKDVLSPTEGRTVTCLLLNCGPSAGSNAKQRREAVKRIGCIAVKKDVDFILLQELKGKNVVKKEILSFIPEFEILRQTGTDTDANILYRKDKYKIMEFNLEKCWNDSLLIDKPILELGIARLSVGFFESISSNPASAKATECHMVVSWHGPERLAKSKEKKKECFESLMKTIDNLSSNSKTALDVTSSLIGGDFNLEKDLVYPEGAKSNTTYTRKDKDGKPIQCVWVDYPTSARRNEKRAGYHRIDEFICMRKVTSFPVSVKATCLCLQDLQALKDPDISDEDATWFKENYLQLDHDPVLVSTTYQIPSSPLAEVKQT
ncbi:uncharacterized protein LOC134197479 [Corticium candelabrum]|uniref:uncharacterized protein LOC134197479 n=1 Tax=Corticium candelabrum TaxID=121492 RepID=UPI002E25DC39|nr:uncharacterized protein LOC134197479 [Corticium candelabrum]